MTLEVATKELGCSELAEVEELGPVSGRPSGRGVPCLTVLAVLAGAAG